MDDSVDTPPQRRWHVIIHAALWVAAAVLATALYVVLQGASLLPSGAFGRSATGELHLTAHGWYPVAALTVVVVVAFGARALAVPAVLIPLTELIGPAPHAPWWLIVTITVVHVLTYGAAALWMRARKVDLCDAGMRDLLHLVVAATFAAPVVTGFVVGLAVDLHTPMAFRTYCRYALAWTTRDMVAVLIAASLPFSVVGALREERPLRRVAVLRRDNADRALLTGQLLFVALSVALSFAVGSEGAHPVYLATPALLWLAATRGHRYAAMGVSCFGVGLAITSALHPPITDLTNLRLQIVGTALLTLAVGAQVDDRRRAAAAARALTDALASSEARYRTVLETAAEGMLVVDAGGRIDLANAAAEAIFDRPRRHIEGRLITELIPAPEGVDEAAHLASLLRAREPGMSSGMRSHVGLRADGAAVALHLSVAQMSTVNGASFTVIVHDDTERKEFEDLLAHQATHDGLTDLPNRALFQDRLHTSLERLRRTPGGLAVMLVDLDHFKEINDNLGHGVGDDVLIEAANRLRAAVRRSDTVARLGGDEFAILCESTVDRRAAAVTARRVLDSIREPFDGIPNDLAPTASIGVRLVYDAEEQAHNIVREADAALYKAKHDGRNCFRVFTRSRTPDVRAPIDLRERLDSDAVEVHYQPVFDTHNGRIVSVEALARLRAADGTLVPPTEFIGEAERCGLIDRLGERVLRQACADIASLQQQHPRLRVSVNVSPRQLADPALTSVVARALRDSRLTPESLTLEITETTAVTAIPRAFAVVRALAESGVHIALDDFGTGGSSLDLLCMLPVDELKIDRSFVQHVCDAGAARAVVAALIDLGRRLALTVIAEGVETIEQANELAQLGCPLLQGFLCSRPVPLDALEAVLAQGARSMPAASSPAAAAD